MVATVYNSSSGPKVIAEMNPFNVIKAHAKLLRDEPHRRDEIEALGTRIAELEEAKGDEGAATVAAPAPAPMGHNAPPADSPFEAIRVHVEDLYAEAKGWIDGDPIATQGQADAVSKLLGMIKEAERAADEARKLENKPFDDGKAEVQARYAPLISDTKAVKGKTVLAAEACRKALTPWLRKLDEEREAAAKLARDEAERIAREARELAASAVSIAQAETAEEMFTDAKAATKEAAHLEADRARVGVGSGYRATILRDNWIATLTDGTVALRHYWTTRRADLEAFALKLAQEDVRAGKRDVPGFTITNERRAA